MKAAIACLICLSPCIAGVISTSLPPDNVYCLGCGNAGVGGASFQSFAVRFVADTSGLLGTVDVAIASISGSNILVLSLLTDSSGSPGVLVESWTATGQMQPIGSATSIVSVASVADPALSAGHGLLACGGCTK